MSKFNWRRALMSWVILKLGKRLVARFLADPAEARRVTRKRKAGGLIAVALAVLGAGLFLLRARRSKSGQPEREI